MTKVGLMIVMVALLSACSGEKGHKPEGQAAEAEQGQKGPHGGQVLELGDHAAHLEVLHDDATGKMTIYVLGPDVKTALAVANPPELKLRTAEGPKVLATRPQGGAGGKSSVFSVMDDALKGREPEGRISIEVNGKVYNPDIEHDHEH